MQTKKLFRKRKGLSRVLTEIIFLLLATTTAIGAFTIYNGYSSSMSGTTKVVIEQVDMISSQNKTYVTIRNVGTTSVQYINITLIGKDYNFKANFSPGDVRTFIIDKINLIAGQQYTIVAKVLDPKNNSTVLYTTTCTVVAKP
ncbi:MAG: hypothetical protein ACPLZF_04365 [Nitrososphaeria archaeon]